MKLLCSALLLFSTSTGLAQTNISPNCVEIENGDVFDAFYLFRNSVVSDDKMLLADYTYFGEKSEALFRLWSTVTGKLLINKKVSHYEERSSQTSLHFSPENRFVYLAGMSGSTNPPNKKITHAGGSVPFWNIANNQLVMSPCSTGMGVSSVQFSHDQKVAYTQTADYHSTLCSTHEKKLFAYTPGWTSDPQAKALFESFASKDYSYFHELGKHYNLPSLHEDVYFYIASEPEQHQATLHTSPRSTTNITLQKPTFAANPPPSANSEFLISGGYLNDESYNQLKDVYKFDQFLVLTNESVWKNKIQEIFILNWKTRKGQVVKFPKAHLGYMKPHWEPKLQTLVIKLVHDDKTVSLNAYDVKRNTLKSVFVSDAIGHTQSVLNSKGEPELHFVAHDRESKKSEYCRM